MQSYNNSTSHIYILETIINSFKGGKVCNFGLNVAAAYNCHFKQIYKWIVVNNSIRMTKTTKLTYHNVRGDWSGGRQWWDCSWERWIHGQRQRVATSSLVHRRRSWECRKATQTCSYSTSPQQILHCWTPLINNAKKSTQVLSFLESKTEKHPSLTMPKSTQLRS